MENEIAGEVNPEVAAPKMYNDIQVNDIVKRRKLELESKHQAEIEQMKAQMQQQQPVSSQNMDVESIKNQVYDKFMGDLKFHRDELAKSEEEKSLRSLAEQYHLKMGKGSQLFDDFNEIMGDFKPSEFSNTAMLAAQMENTPEIMYELANNPGKLAEIEALAERSPNMAKKQLEKLAKSINSNLEAKQNNVTAPPPLSQVKSSASGVDSNKMNLKDMKNASWLR